MIVENDPNNVIGTIQEYFRRQGNRRMYINQMYLIHVNDTWILHLSIPDETVYVSIMANGMNVEQYKKFIIKELIRRNIGITTEWYTIRRGDAVNLSNLNVYSENPDDLLLRPKDIYLKYVPNL